ncbi:hypothetical protein DIPPA_06548 [Diplonema papillatum]|nr:hypothetical protein DIPPA_06548 [Diplonema papillatum]
MDAVANSKLWSKAMTTYSLVRESVITMWFLGKTLRGIWESSKGPDLIERNKADHNTKLTAFLCCFSLALLGEVFGPHGKRANPSWVVNDT